MSSLGLGHASGEPAPDYLRFPLSLPSTQAMEILSLEVQQPTLGTSTPLQQISDPSIYSPVGRFAEQAKLTCLNQNCDIPIRSRTPVCQMNENHPISAESQHNFHFFSPTLTQKLQNQFSPFLHDVEQLVALLMHASARR